jgi:hypothetical protein
VAQGVGPEFKPHYQKKKKKSPEAGCQWLTLVILAALEAEIRTIVQGQSREIVPEIPISKITRAKWTGDVAQA